MQITSNNYNQNFTGIYRGRINKIDFEIFKESILPILSEKETVVAVNGRSIYDGALIKSIQEYGKQFGAGFSWAVANLNKYGANLDFPDKELLTVFTGAKDTKLLEMFTKSRYSVFKFHLKLANFFTKRFPKEARQPLALNKICKRESRLFDEFLERNKVKNFNDIGELFSFEG